jgi:short-subunit dehydrogenase involved in D-alanine esterification of teichoic acids
MNLSGNTILITGGASGIGLALALAFGRYNNRILVLGRDEGKLRSAKEKYPFLDTHPCDITQKNQVDHLVDRIASDFDDLNFLVNNAGIQYRYRFNDGEDHIDRIQQETTTNFTAHLILTDCLMPFLLKRPSAIVNVSSALAIVPKESAPVYCATKAALHSFSKALRYQLESTDVRVFEIMPPMVDTEMTRGRGKDKITPEELAEEALEAIEKNRFEIRIGKTRFLSMIHRLYPGYAEKMIRKA